MKQDKALSMLGMAAKAGKAVSGEYQTEHAVKSNEAYLVLIAKDASDNTKKMFRNMCAYYEVEIAVYGSKDSLGHAIGKGYRSSVAVTDEGLAKNVQKNLAETTTE